MPVFSIQESRKMIGAELPVTRMSPQVQHERSGARVRDAVRAWRLGPRREADLGTLVREAMAGEERAWAQLVTRFGPMIRSVARRHRLCEADQDEVVQRTWLRLVERISSMREPEAIGGWLVTTASRESLRIIELSAREVRSDQLADEEADGTAVEDVVIAEERRIALYRALEGLLPRQRALLELQLAAPAMSYEQMGAALDMPVGAIGPTRGRSLARLRRDARLVDVIGAQRRHGFPLGG
jgi:RNA polymerase sigma factor (sigma-70 family)